MVTCQPLAPAYAATMPPENLEPRVSALEGEELRDFRKATTASFNAMRQDMVDMRRDMTDGFADMRSKFALTAAGQERIVELLHTVIDTQGGSAPA